MIVKRKYLYIYQHYGIFFFRIFGYGLHFKDISKCQPTFSERNNKGIFSIGNLKIKFLKPLKFLDLCPSCQYKKYSHLFEVDYCAETLGKIMKRPKRQCKHYKSILTIGSKK